jgi:hypothetical protein
MTDRQEFLRLRALGIGGSDCASLLEPLLRSASELAPKYGCQRRLMYEKGGWEPDFDREETGPMKLGNILEPHACDAYAEKTGRRVLVVGQQKHPHFPELVGHVDRLIHSDHRPDQGVLECKALGLRVFYEMKRTGLLIDYLLQIQHYMTVNDLKWGSFCVVCRDSFEILWWDVERVDEICNAVLVEGPKFWALATERRCECGCDADWHRASGEPCQGCGECPAFKAASKCPAENLPDRLNPDDSRCQNCQYRLSCQGNALMESMPDGSKGMFVMPELTGLAVERIARAEMLKQATELVAETDEMIRGALGDRTEVMVPINGELRPIYWKAQPGTPLWKGHAEEATAMLKMAKEKAVAAGVPAEDLPVLGAPKLGMPKRPLLLQFLETKKKKNVIAKRSDPLCLPDVNSEAYESIKGEL